jgi:hypothetical protein
MSFRNHNIYKVIENDDTISLSLTGRELTQAENALEQAENAWGDACGSNPIVHGIRVYKLHTAFDKLSNDINIIHALSSNEIRPTRLKQLLEDGTLVNCGVHGTHGHLEMELLPRAHLVHVHVVVQQREQLPLQLHIGCEPGH